MFNRLIFGFYMNSLFQKNIIITQIEWHLFKYFV